MIKVEHLKKSFGATVALNDLSFTIPGPGVVGLLGPNGAGKTTTMRVLTGFLTADSGTIEIEGISLDDLHVQQVQKHLGYLPENNPLYKGMLVSEFLNFTADLKGIPASTRKTAFDTVVKATALEEVFYKPIGDLSKGFRQRVGMAAALLGNPDILILDEPTEGLDPNQRVAIRNLIKELGKTHTIIVSTHVLSEALAVCSRMLIIHQGKLVADGTPEELSRAASAERTLHVELEGKNIPQHLTTLPGASVSHESEVQGHYSCNLGLPATLPDVRPALSELIRVQQWTVWKLVEEEHGLEDIFRSLTKEKIL